MYKIIFLISFICPLSLVAQVPPTISIDGLRLQQNKLDIAYGNKVFVQALRNLVSNADDLLTQGPYSVTYKDTTLGGASIHDYLSLARYYWPNPSEPRGTPFIRRDGHVYTGRDKISDYKMMNDLANNVLELGMAYYYTCDEKYANHAKFLIRVFFFDEETRMNPNFEYSQIILGRPASGGASISATSLISLVEGVQLISASKHWRKADHKRLQSWFNEFLDWMLSSEKGKQQGRGNNNVGTYYTLQTAVYALFVEKRELAKTIVEEQAVRRIDEQINERGEMAAELRRATPWNYVKYNLTAFDKLVEVAKKVDVDLWGYESENGGSIQKAFEWLIPYALGEKEWKYSKERVSPPAVRNVLGRTKNVNSRVTVMDSSSSLTYKQILF